MEANFITSLTQVLRHEGGWADHPKDPGGATMKGVTLATFRRHFGQSMTKEDLRNITNDELGVIYRVGYWSKCHCHELPAGIDYAVFDAAVNSGPGRSARWLQSAIDTTVDGRIGPNTLAKANSKDPIAIIKEMCADRLTFLRQLGTWRTFGRGWERRVTGVQSFAVSLTDSEILVDAPPSVAYEILSRGDQGEAVKKLQRALQIEADGIFGRDTEGELQQWQLLNGLEADGIAGRNTYQALGLLE
ncbi:MAG: glycoside hydrolase family 108 protein [Pseudomonadales bacterium]|nr:glycoside hydrolase family 108 protein [Pseudomonadales bacterium]